MGKPPYFKSGQLVWYLDNETLEPRSGMIGCIASHTNKGQPVSYIILRPDDGENGEDAVIRHEPFIFTEEKECRAFAEKYVPAVKNIVDLFIRRVSLVEPVDREEMMAYISDVSATFHGRLETMVKGHDVHDFCKTHVSTEV